ncbi:hypothetical protein ACHAWF_011215 [Thalassiosira exigua]
MAPPRPLRSLLAVAVVLIARIASADAFSPPAGRCLCVVRGPRVSPRPSGRSDDDVGDGRADDHDERRPAGIRLNKAFKATHSRREADQLVASGRVTVNGRPVPIKGGMMVVPHRDVVALDGVVVTGWEEMNAVTAPGPPSGGSLGGNEARADLRGRRRARSDDDDDDDLGTSSFEYVKYFKPKGVTCTTDPRVRDNVVRAVERDGYEPRHRVYPVGRLDKQTTGLILLTSDGRLVNAALRGERKKKKVYQVMVDGRLEEDHLQQLRDGIVIRTVAQRKGRTEEENALIAKTLPCDVERIGPSSCRMTLVEGRNRQIRKMMEALGFRVVKLHRVEFMGIRLDDGGGGGGRELRRPGAWARLDDAEMRLVKDAIRSAEARDKGG